jgi:hypothetical protein
VAVRFGVHQPQRADRNVRAPHMKIVCARKTRGALCYEPPAFANCLFMAMAYHHPRESVFAPEVGIGPFDRESSGYGIIRSQRPITEGSGPQCVMNSATIKLFLPRGDAKSLRTAEISNWTGKAIAAPRTELDELLQRDELDKAGVYILSGTDPLSGTPRAYIGEAEVIRERLKQHKTKEFWISAIVFVSKDENLTKAHVRYLENRLLTEAAQVGRCALEQNQAGGSKLPESDREDMEVFLSRIRQLLPVLGSDLLIPIAQPAAKQQSGGMLFCRRKGAEARGYRTPDGFVVLHGSTAVLEERPSASRWPNVVTLRKQLIADGTLTQKDGFLHFTRDTQFSSPSAAAAVVEGGSANGLIDWRTKHGKVLKELDEQS